MKIEAHRHSHAAPWRNCSLQWSKLLVIEKPWETCLCIRTGNKGLSHITASTVSSVLLWSHPNRTTRLAPCPSQPLHRWSFPFSAFGGGAQHSAASSSPKASPGLDPSKGKRLRLERTKLVIKTIDAFSTVYPHISSNCSALPVENYRKCMNDPDTILKAQVLKKAGVYSTYCCRMSCTSWSAFSNLSLSLTPILSHVPHLLQIPFLSWSEAHKYFHAA